MDPLRFTFNPRQADFAGDRLDRKQTTLTHEEEMILLRQARALDEAALTRIHEHYYRAIYRYIGFRVEDQVVVEDLTSEVFIRLLTALRDKNAPQNTIRGWLYGTASNLVKNHYRHKKRHPEVELNEQIARAEEPLGRLVDQKITEERLYAAMDALTEDQQHVLSLRFGNGFSITESARMVGKSEAAVKMLQARAIATLAKVMGQEAN